MKLRILAFLWSPMIGVWLAGSATVNAGFPSENPGGKDLQPAARQAGVVAIGNANASATGIMAKLRNPADANAAALVMAMDRRNLRVDRKFQLVPGLQRLIPKPDAAVRKMDAKFINDTIKDLQMTGLFEYVEPDWIVQTQAVPSDAAFSDGRLWGLRNTGQSGGTPGADIGAVSAWDNTTGSTDVVVAVIDTGIRYTHQDLAANIWRNPGESGSGRETNGIDDDANGYIDDVHGINAITGSGNPMDDHDHGTHCAGTIGAVANGGGPHVGVAWNVRLMGLKFLDVDGYGSTSDAITCVNYAVTKGARILSNSWGGGPYSQAFYDSIEAARQHGVLFVAAAGNESNNNDITGHYPSNYELPNVVAVAALDRGDRLAWFSNYGFNSVHLGAPGVDIYSCTAASDTSYDFYDGTSMAAPHVSGAAALLAAAYPNATYVELKQRLLAGRPVSSMAGLSITGNALNVHQSLVEVGRFANGSFEQGLNFWTSEGNLTYSTVGGIPGTVGGRCVVFNNAQRPPNGVITQRFETFPGETYTLDFNVGVLAFNTQQQKLRVTVESAGTTLLNNTTTVTGGGGGSTRWSSRQFQFTPTSDVTIIRFHDVSTTTNSIDLLLDNVKVTGRQWNLNVSTSDLDGEFVYTLASVSPLDVNGQGDAFAYTPFQLRYENRQTVSLRAVEVTGYTDPFSRGYFSHWLKNGSFDTTNPSTTVVMTADTNMEAVYEIRGIDIPSITSPLTAVAIQGLPFEYRITATEYPTDYGANGLPPGLSLNWDMITGIPTVPGEYAVQLAAAGEAGSGNAILALTVMPEPDDYLTERFSGGNDTGGQSFMFIPDGSSNHYRVVRRNVTTFPTDPAGGQPIGLNDDSFLEVSFPNGEVFPFFGEAYTSFFIGSNGYVTFGSGDSDFSESLEDHFFLPRIAALFDDLNPGAGGSVSWKQTADRMTVTFDGVREFGAVLTNAFQIEMFFDGRIRITILALSATDGLIGLSRGFGLPVNFTPTDFSAYPLGVSLASLFDDFDPNYDAPLWMSFGGTVTANTAGQAAGPGSTGNSLHFDGDGSRYALTSPIDTRSGGSVSFRIALANGLESPWEYADDIDTAFDLDPFELVVLEYSIDGEASFVQIGGPYDNRSWQMVTVPIPVAARNEATQFRWRQLENSGDGFDHWALDNVRISSVPLGPVIAVEQPVGTPLANGAANVDFSNAIVGGFVSVDFTVRNWGDQDLSGLNVSIDGGSASDFAVTGHPPASLAPGSSATFTVRFSPSVTGGRSANLHIGSNDAMENPFEISLHGTGVSAGIAVSLFANGNYVDLYGAGDDWDPIGEVAATRTALENLGYAVVPFTGITDTDWNAAFAADVVVIPELENAPLTLSPEAILAINSHLAAGKGLVVMGSGSYESETSGYAHQFLNSLRGWSLILSGALDYGEELIKVAGVPGFENAPAVVWAKNATFMVATSSLPLGAQPVYQYEGTTTAVFLAGPVVYLGYDWFEGADPTWTEVLLHAITAVGGQQPPVVMHKITQSLGDGSQSNWGDLFGGSSDYLVDADLTTANGLSEDTFDGVGVLSIVPPVTLPRLTATQVTGPLVSSAVSSGLNVRRQVSLVSGRHATDEEITVTNISGSNQSVTLRIDDNYGSDGDTRVHRTSSGDSVVTASDHWFVSNDVTDIGAISGDPTLMVSWRYSSNLPVPTFPLIPASGIGFLTIDFGAFSLPSGQTVTVTIRRELFDSAELALLNGLPLSPAVPEIAVEHPPGTELIDNSGSLSIGSATLGSSAGPLTLTIRNVGSANLTSLSVSKSGSHNGDFTVGALGSTSLAPGASTSFTVDFTPSAVGARTASLQIGSNDADENPFDIALSGIGVGVPEIVVEHPTGFNLEDGDSIGCGTANVGISTAPLTVTLRNAGSANLSGMVISITGSHATDFAVGNLGTTTLAPGADTTFNVTFTPGAAGSRQADLRIASNDADENPFDIALTGTGLPVGPPPVVHSATGYRPGAQMVMSVGIDYAGQTLSALGYSLQLPAGWSYVSDTSSAGVKPVAGGTGTVEWAWLTVPAGSTSFSLTLLAPPSASGNQLFSAVATLANAQGNQTQIAASPNPLSVPLVSLHTADADSDGRYGLTELLSVISLYNHRDGTTRTGEYYRDGGVFRPGPGTQNPPYHSTDLDSSWRISLAELLSDISLYNYRDGTVRTGEYHYDLPSNRFVPGPAPSGTVIKGAPAIASVDLSATLGNLSGPLSDAGGNASLRVSLAFNRSQTSSLGVEFTLPAGWAMVSENSGNALVKPDTGQTGELGWAWSEVPASPVEFNVTVSYPPATASGTIAGRAIAGDSGGGQTQDAISIEIGRDPYAEWADAAFDGAPSGTDTGLIGDPDLDGHTNLIEYALGTDPLAGSDIRPVLVFNAGGQPRLSLTKGIVAGLDPRVRYVVEASTNLANWSTVGVAIIENSANRITADYTLPSDGVFMRLSVTMAP